MIHRNLRKCSSPSAQFDVSLHMNRFIWTIFFVALVSVSCRYPSQFQNAQPETAHAVLRGTKYPNAGSIFPSHINGQPTSFWRSSDLFRVAHGTNTCDIAFSSRKETVGYATVGFMAKVGSDYQITRSREAETDSSFSTALHPVTRDAWIIHDWRDRAIIHEIRKDGSRLVVAETPRQESVFGVDSAGKAITKYRRENP